MNSEPYSGSSALATAEAGLQRAADAIGAARMLLDQGNVVDLSGLEKHVEQACTAIPALPADQRQDLKPALVALIDALNDLTDCLKTQHRELSDILKGIGSRRQAASAYRPVAPGKSR